MAISLKEVGILEPRVQRLEDQYHEVNEKLHSLSMSHNESLLLLETYMKDFNSMKSILIEVKESVQKIQMPDKAEWEKEAILNRRIESLESMTKTIKFWGMWGGSIITVLVGALIIGLSKQDIYAIMGVLIGKFL